MAIRLLEGNFFVSVLKAICFASLHFVCHYIACAWANCALHDLFKWMHKVRMKMRSFVEIMVACNVALIIWIVNKNDILYFINILWSIVHYHVIVFKIHNCSCWQFVWLLCDSFRCAMSAMKNKNIVKNKMKHKHTQNSQLKGKHLHKTIEMWMKWIVTPYHDMTCHCKRAILKEALN